MLVAGKSAAAAAWVSAPEVERAWAELVWALAGQVWPQAAARMWEAQATALRAQAPLPPE